MKLRCFDEKGAPHDRSLCMRCQSSPDVASETCICFWTSHFTKVGIFQAEARFTSPNQNCYNTDNKQESFVSTGLRNECCTGYCAEAQ